MADALVRWKSMGGTLGRMRFRTTVELGGKTATGLRVPPEIVAGLAKGKKPAVRVTIRGHTYRSTVAVMGGAFFIPLSAENRGSAGVVAGDEVDVDVEFDAEPREVSVPPDITAALGRDVDARRFFDGLSYSHKRRYVIGIEEAKTAETRQRRIDKAVSVLRDGRN